MKESTFWDAIVPRLMGADTTVVFILLWIGFAGVILWTLVAVSSLVKAFR